MYIAVIILHIIISILLAFIILIQSGRSAGLAESFQAAESIFGTKTNAFLVRATTVLATLFFITSLSLVFLSKEKQKSLMEKVPAVSTQSLPFLAPEANVPAGPGGIQEVTAPTQTAAPLEQAEESAEPKAEESAKPKAGESGNK